MYEEILAGKDDDALAEGQPRRAASTSPSMKAWSPE